MTKGDYYLTLIWFRFA